ncbi:TetR family transcriptional regulator protein (plasmid) [Rhizobium gallicum]|uniref:TetR family transcriptional regulator protein n=1 Tax=Rhizobium gallicum TaxID=56730 RepID=A0A1L5NY20_9HYPH|nr:TetR/AcrR family transcriptional regulator [Rhizobium gallicum]APO72736.1 TetR family transcriptional regulator protein [Rhizobium gallicum]
MDEGIKRPLWLSVSTNPINSAARELFRDKGYAGASMQDLADRVGLRKASLYMRFPNKEALVPEVLDMTLRETVPEDGSDDRPWLEIYADRIRDIAQNLADRKRCVGLHLAYGVDDETPAAKEAVRAFFLSLREYLTTILAKGLSRETAVLLATDALVRIEGATLMTAVFDESDAMERAIQATIRDAATGLR